MFNTGGRSGRRSSLGTMPRLGKLFGRRSQSVTELALPSLLKSGKMSVKNTYHVMLRLPDGNRRMVRTFWFSRMFCVVSKIHKGIKVTW